ncbi:MAG: Yip1 family protein [Gaiellaceae bacterium]
MPGPLAAPEPADLRLTQWGRNAFAVLRRPIAVFASFRGDSEEDAAARSEPALALTLMAGMAGALMTSQARTLLDDGQIHGLVAAIWIFIVGSVYGLVVYWLLGGLLFASIRSFGGELDYRRCRQMLAYACAPIALGLLVVTPLRLLAFGGDALRSGGSDSGLGGSMLDGLSYAFTAWAVLLLVVAVRAANRWRWEHALGAAGLALALLGGLLVGTHLLG